MAASCARDGFDDGQSEPVPVLVVCPAPIEPLEGLEEAVDVRRRDQRSGIGHRQDGLAVRLPVVTSTRPSASLCRTALASRLATSRSTSSRSPSRGAGSVISSMWILIALRHGDLASAAAVLGILTPRSPVKSSAPAGCCAP